MDRKSIFYHLSFNDIRKVLINLKKSKIKYCLITNHRVNSKHLNKDITTGSFRRLSLFKEPLNFKKLFIKGKRYIFSKYKFSR